MIDKNEKKKKKITKTIPYKLQFIDNARLMTNLLAILLIILLM